MGCGCNGTGNDPKLAERLAAAAGKPVPVPDPVAPVNPSVAENTQQFSLMKGKTRISGPYGSRLEAEADNVRRGYVGRVEPA